MRNVLAAVALIIAASGLGVAVWLYQKSVSLSDTTTQSSSDNSLPTTSTSTASEPQSPVTFAVLGDDFSGTEVLPADQQWVEQFAQEMCWTAVTQSTVPGSGYTEAAGQVNPDAVFARRIGEVVASHPRVVIVQGGSFDVPEAITAGASDVFGQLRVALGNQATLIAIAPIAPPGADVAAFAPVSGAILNAALPFGVSFIDPVADGWFTDPRSFTGEPPTLSSEGATQFARRLEASIQQQGIQPSASCQ